MTANKTAQAEQKKQDAENAKVNKAAEKHAEENDQVVGQDTPPEKDPLVKLHPTSTVITQADVSDVIPRRGDPFAHQRKGGSEEGKRQQEEGEKADKEADKE